MIVVWENSESAMPATKFRTKLSTFCTVGPEILKFGLLVLETTVIQMKNQKKILYNDKNSQK